MEALIYFGIILITIIIAEIRARKGKKSRALLTIVFLCITGFNLIAIINAYGYNDEKTVRTGIVMTGTILIVYFATIYITGKEAEKKK